MKKLWILLLSAVCSLLLVLVSQAQPPSQNADAVGIVLLKPEGERIYEPIGSGVYVGKGIVFTNWHIATNAALLILEGVDFKNEDQLLTYQVGSRENSRVNNWICSIAPSSNPSNSNQPTYRISSTNTDNCIPYNLTKWQAFRPSISTSAPMPTIEIEQLLFLNRDLEVAVVKVNPQEFNQLKISPPCLETQPVKKGEKLIIKSHAYGRYPAITVTATVQDDQPKLLIDPDTRVPEKNRYAAMSIIATLPTNAGDAVGPGSSGGPVFNQKGKLVGLVWTGQDLPDGTKEVWITPASAWISQLQRSRIPDEDLNKVLNESCPARL